MFALCMSNVHFMFNLYTLSPSLDLEHNFSQVVNYVLDVFNHKAKRRVRNNYLRGSITCL